MPDWSTWTPYLQTAAVAAGAWTLKTVVQQGRDITQIQTTLKYYVERQTEDAARRLDVNNPVPVDIQELVRKHIHRVELTGFEHEKLTTWLRWTGKGLNPDADSAERSAALQLLTGIRTKEYLPAPRPWYRWLFL